jgi:hypothetical protein
MIHVPQVIESIRGAIAWLRRYGSMLPPDPDFSGMEEGIEEVFWTSLMHDEGRPCRPRIVLQASLELASSVLALVKPVTLCRKSLKTLSMTSGPQLYLVCDPGAPAQITGLMTPPAPGLQGLTIEVVGPAKLDFRFAGKLIVAFRAGEISTAHALVGDPLEMVLRRAAAAVGAKDTGGLLRLVRNIWRQGHGGAVWFSSHPDVLRSEYLPIGFRFASSPNPGEWVGCDIAALADLCGTDGAMLVGPNLEPIGFNAFIHAPPVENLHMVDLQRKTSVITKPASQLGNGRHGSSASFCNLFRPSAAIVVSADDRLTVMIGEEDRRDRGPVCYPLPAALIDFPPG